MDVEVYIRDKDRRTIGSTSSWKSLTVKERRNDVGRWTLVTTSPEDAQVLSPTVDNSGKIIAPRGVLIRRDDGGTTIDVMSGWCGGLPDVENNSGKTEWAFSGWDENIILADTLCWPKPDAAVSAQTDTHDVRTGQRSNRIRDYFNANVRDRLGIPGVDAGPALNLGVVGTSRARFVGLLELAQEIAGRELNFTIRQRDTDRALFLYQWKPVDKRLDVQFTPETGTVHSWSYTATDTAATRVIIGAGGEGTARMFRQYINSAEEINLGEVRKVERFKDRRDLQSDNPDWITEADEDAAEFLLENSSRATFRIDATDMPGLRVAADLRAGDLVRAYTATDTAGQPIGLVEDLIEETTTKWDSEGERTEVRIGTLEELDPMSRLARQMRVDRRRIADLEARR